MVGRRIEIEGRDRRESGGARGLRCGRAADTPVMAIETGPRRRGEGRRDSGAYPFEASALSVDERSALCLLSMARDLLKQDHPAVAAMIDYAMLDVAIGQTD